MPVPPVAPSKNSSSSKDWERASGMDFGSLCLTYTQRSQSVNVPVRWLFSSHATTAHLAPGWLVPFQKLTLFLQLNFTRINWELPIEKN